MAEATLAKPSITHFIVKQLKPARHGVSEADLATAIQEVEIQTQIAGASFLKVHVIDADPLWKITDSGLLAVNEDGLLNELQVEFPEGTGYWWQLAAVEGSTEIAQANLILTFEDRIVARLRQQWKHRTMPAGLTTRAQFVKALVHECNLKERLNPPIRFVSPGLNRVEPVEESTEEKQEKVKTPAEKAQAQALKNKEVGPVTRHSWAESLLKAGGWPISENNVKALVGWETAEGGAGPQFHVANNSANYNPLNTTQSEPGATNTGVQGNIKSYVSWAQGIEATIATLKNGSYANIIAALVAGNNAGAVARAVGTSPWGTEAALVESAVAAASASGAGEGIATAVQIPAGSKGGESDVGQLSRGTPNNPDEDSWDCITRLAQEVSWSAFTDGRNTLFYMDGPDLIHQRPVLYLDPVNNHIVREDKRGHAQGEYGAIMRPLSFTYDNTAFLYRATHKVKGRIQRKSRITKPQTPSEVRLSLLCGITEYRAGDVFVFRNCGPISENGGRWIVSDATRECIKEPFTKFILVPPTSPLKEPQASATSAPGTEAETVAKAFEAASKLSGMQIPYLWGGGHGPEGLTSYVKAGCPGLDCSGSVCWVLKQAGMFPASSAETSGGLEKNWGEPGEGSEMTVWAGPNHTFIEFANVPEHATAQLNTNGPQNGPRLYTLSQTPTYNPAHNEGGPGTSGGPFVPRHWKGT